MLEVFKGISQTLSASGDKETPPAPPRPKIGLALGGGAARGFAHIGILRTLIANGIMPDIIVGTSIGAVVGGSYAAGHLDTFEEWARHLGPRSVFGYLDIRLNGSGLIGGDKLAAQLDATFGRITIEELPLKYVAVATEVKTGHEIWLNHGRLVDAMRAHATQIQVDGPFFALSNNIGHKAFGREHYILTHGERGPGEGEFGWETDLFAGL